MALWENRGPVRRAQLEELAPGSTLGARIDRGAWAALSQVSPGAWSWTRAIGTLVLAALAALVIYLTIYNDIAWVVGLVIAYALLLWRARAAHADYLRRSGA